MLESGTLIDAGFESRSDGTALDTNIWTVDGSPANAEYDTAQAKVGTVSAYLRGPAASVAGAKATLTLNADGAELRFWHRRGETNLRSILQDGPAAAGDRTFFMDFAADGKLYVYTQRAGITGYTQNTNVQVDTYSANAWVEYRVLFNFSAQTYTLSKRSAVGDAWTGLKSAGASDYNIPFYGSNTRSATTAFYPRVSSVGGAATLWLDDIRYSNTGIVDSPVITAHPTDQETLYPGNEDGTGAEATFSVTATGDNLTYQWERSTGGAYADVAGATSASLVVGGNITNNGATYRCKVTNAAETVTSNAATFSLYAPNAETTTACGNPAGYIYTVNSMTLSATVDIVQADGTTQRCALGVANRAKDTAFVDGAWAFSVDVPAGTSVQATDKYRFVFHATGESADVSDLTYLSPAIGATGDLRADTVGGSVWVFWTGTNPHVGNFSLTSVFTVRPVAAYTAPVPKTATYGAAEPFLTGVDHEWAVGGVTLSNGREMVFYRKDPGVDGGHTTNNGYIAMVYKDPGGTLQGPFTVYHDPDYNCSNISPGVRDDGRVCVIFRRTNVTSPVYPYTYTTIDLSEVYCDNPLDDTPTWSSKSTVPQGNITITYGPIERLIDGRYYVAGYATGHAEMLLSDDMMTWALDDRVVVATDSGIGEISIKQVDADRMVAAARHSDAAHPHLCLYTSNTTGETWSAKTDWTTPYWMVSPYWMTDDANGDLYLMANERRVVSVGLSVVDYCSQMRAFRASYDDFFASPGTALVTDYEFERILQNSHPMLGTTFVLPSYDNETHWYWVEGQVDAEGEDADVYRRSISGLTFAPPPMPPAKPSDVAAAFHTDHVDVTWVDGSLNETTFKVQRSVDGGDYADCTDSPTTANATSFEDHHLPGSWESLVYRVCATNATGDSAWVVSNVISLGLEAEGSTDSTGDAVLLVTRLLTAEATVDSSAEALLDVIRALVAEGAVATVGDAALLVRRLLAAEGTVALVGDASFGAPTVLLTAEGTVVLVGDALLSAGFVLVRYDGTITLGRVSGTITPAGRGGTITVAARGGTITVGEADDSEDVS